MVFINARSLNKDKLDELELHFNDFDIIGVCETWFNDGIIDS